MDAERELGAPRNVISSEYLYKGKILNLRVDHVKFRSGRTGTREVVEHRPAVAVLAISADGLIYLVSQYRHAVDETLYEVPAGLVEEGEKKEEAASRELQEEIGMKPGVLEELLTLYTSPGFSDEELIFFLATDLTPSELPQDEDEHIRVFKFTPDEAMAMIESGRIKDGKTVAAIYWHQLRELRKNVCAGD